MNKGYCSTCGMLTVITDMAGDALILRCDHVETLPSKHWRRWECCGKVQPDWVVTHYCSAL